MGEVESRICLSVIMCPYQTVSTDTSVISSGLFLSFDVGKCRNICLFMPLSTIELLLPNYEMFSGALNVSATSTLFHPHPIFHALLVKLTHVVSGPLPKQTHNVPSASLPAFYGEARKSWLPIFHIFRRQWGTQIYCLMSKLVLKF